MKGKSIHPYEPYIPGNATKLIVGTIPPYRFCIPCGELYPEDVRFYYGSRDNYFWELVSQVVGVSLKYENTKNAVEERKALLSKLNMGITDMIEKCVHKNEKSDDKSLGEIELKNFPELLSKHPKINTLIYTSKFVRTLINNYKNQYADFLVADMGYHRGWDKSRKKGYVIIGGTEYAVHILYSPSPNCSRRVRKETRYNQYCSVFWVGESTEPFLFVVRGWN